MSKFLENNAGIKASVTADGFAFGVEKGTEQTTAFRGIKLKF